MPKLASRRRLLVTFDFAATPTVPVDVAALFLSQGRAQVVMLAHIPYCCTALSGILYSTTPGFSAIQS